MAQVHWRLQRLFVFVCSERRHRALVQHSHILHQPGPFPTLKVHRDKMLKEGWGENTMCGWIVGGVGEVDFIEFLESDRRKKKGKKSNLYGHCPARLDAVTHHTSPLENCVVGVTARHTISSETNRHSRGAAVTYSCSVGSHTNSQRFSLSDTLKTQYAEYKYSPTGRIRCRSRGLFRTSQVAENIALCTGAWEHLAQPTQWQLGVPVERQRAAEQPGTSTNNQEAWRHQQIRHRNQWLNTTRSPDSKKKNPPSWIHNGLCLIFNQDDSYKYY